jgi:hypothetical protein
MNRFLQFTAVALIAGLGVPSVIQAQEKKIKREDLPAAVERTVAEQAKGAAIRGFSKEVERGVTYYEAELTVNGHGRDILMDQQGNIVEVEEEVSLDSLPAVVRDGLQKAAATGKIGKVESLWKKGKLIAYEAKVTTAGKKSEVQVGPDGKKLAHTE